MSAAGQAGSNPTAQHTLRRLTRNAGQLLTGNASAAAMGLASVALSARGLGAELFGIFAVVQTYVRVVDGLVNFQSWQAMIRYGIEALKDEDPTRFHRLIKFGFLVDGLTAAAGGVVAISLAWFWAGAFAWEGFSLGLVAIYAGLFMLNVNGTPLAVLRMFDRFDAQAWARFVPEVVRLGALAGAFALGAGLWWCVIIWAVCDALRPVLLMFTAGRELARRGHGRFWRASARGVSRAHRGVWRFLLSSNLTSSIKLVGRELDVLILAVMLGPVAAGGFKIAKLFAKAVGYVIEPVDEAIYPELARLWSVQHVRRFVRTILTAGAALGTLGLAILAGLALTGQSLLSLTVGDEYLSVYAPLLIYTAPSVLIMFGIGLRSAILSMNRPSVLLTIHLTAHVLYFACLPWLLMRYDLIGAAAARWLLVVPWLVGMSTCVTLGIRRREGLAPAAA